jgi:hypothetical protein
MYKYECENFCCSDNTTGYIEANSISDAREKLIKRGFKKIISIIEVPYKANLLR